MTLVRAVADATICPQIIDGHSPNCNQCSLASASRDSTGLLPWGDLFNNSWSAVIGGGRYLSQLHSSPFLTRGVLHNVVYNNIPGCPNLTAIDRETLSVQDTHPHSRSLAHIAQKRQVIDVGTSVVTHVDNDRPRKRRLREREREREGRSLCCYHIGYQCPSFISCLTDTSTSRSHFFSIK